MSRYPISKSQCDAFDELRTKWEDHYSRRSIEEKVEVVEVTDFVWDFLVRKLFGDPARLSPWRKDDGGIC